MPVLEPVIQRREGSTAAADTSKIDMEVGRRDAAWHYSCDGSLTLAVGYFNEKQVLVFVF